MRASRVRVEDTARGAALAADISSDKGAFEPLTLRMEYVGLAADRLLLNGDAFVPALLWSAMRLGEPLVIESGISPDLYENLEAIQIMSAAWIPGLQPIPVETTRRPRLPAAVGNGLFFSCGVDSFYSLWKHRSSLTHLICVQGFDMTLEEDQPFARLFASTCEVARAFGLVPVEVRTNLRTLTDRIFPWLDIFASGLAAVGLSAQGLMGKCAFATDCHFSHFTHRATHPALDHLWSADNLALIHDGFELNRLEKVSRLAGFELAMRHLRVCLVDPVAYNCGRCEKCLRTMLELYTVGALEKYAVFPTKLKPEDIARVRIDSPAQLEYYREAQHVLENSQSGREYAKAIRRAIRTYSMRERYHRLRSIMKRAPGGGLMVSGMDRTKSLLSGTGTKRHSDRA